MAQEFIPTPGGNIYPDPDTDYDQSEAFRQVALNRDSKDNGLATDAAFDATTKANSAKVDAIADATTKYGGLPARVTAVEAKNVRQDERLGDLEDLRAVKCVRLEVGQWVWDTVAGTHYVIPDHDGSLVVRATPWPVPNPTTPELTW